MQEFLFNHYFANMVFMESFLLYLDTYYFKSIGVSKPKVYVSGSNPNIAINKKTTMLASARKASKDFHQTLW